MESNEKVLCGVMRYDNEVVEIYVDTTNGDVTYASSDSVPMLVGMLTIMNPIEIESVDNLLKPIDKQSYGSCIGAIATKSGVYVLTSETTCELRKYTSAKIPTGDVIDIDLNMCY